MRTAIVTSSELGANCWSAMRFTRTCHKCDRYDRCRYPERVANEQYDSMRAEAKRLKDESDRLYRELKLL